MTKETIIKRCFYELFICGGLEGFLGVLLFDNIPKIMVKSSLSSYTIGIINFSILPLTIFLILISWYCIIDKRDKRLKKYGFTL